MKPLAPYIFVCCCEHETLSPSILSELKNKCRNLVKTSDSIKKTLGNETCTYIRCDVISNFCEKCMDIKRGKSKTKKK